MYLHIVAKYQDLIFGDRGSLCHCTHPTDKERETAGAQGQIGRPESRRKRMMEGRRPWRLALLALAAVAVSFISISVRVHHGLIHDRMPKTSILQHHRRLSLLDPKSVETKGRTKSLRSTGNSPLQGDFELIEQSLQSYQSELAQTHENTHAQTGPAMSHMSVIQAAKDVKFGSYDLNAGLLATEAFHYTIFFFVYDSKSDTFRVWHNVPGCDHGCVRIYRVASVIAYALRKNFPARFKGPDSDDIVIMMSCGDAPRIKTPCYDKSNDYCHSSKFAPILQFGSVYIDTNILPSAIAMPMPVRPHIPCFDDWQLYRKVCQDLLPRTNAMSDRIRDGIVFGDTRRKNYWDKLIPQVLWRGTDFAYLHMKHPEMRPPNYKTDIRPFEKEAHPTDGRWAINALYGMEKQLLPRWRGVLLTSEAEIEAKEYRESGNRNVIPWCNIKFSNCYEKGEKVLAINNAKLKQLERVGISAIGDHLNMTEHAKYKYREYVYQLSLASR